MYQKLWIDGVWFLRNGARRTDGKSDTRRWVPHLKKTKKNKWEGRYSERVRVKFYRAFKLSFPQLTCKASLIFKSNLELALSIISEERELYELKHVAVECRCPKIWDPLSFLTCLSIPVSKFLVCGFTCASCGSGYIGETFRHYKTRIEEHIKRITSLIFLNIYTQPQQVWFFLNNW